MWTLDIQISKLGVASDNTSLPARQMRVRDRFQNIQGWVHDYRALFRIGRTRYE